LVQVVKLLNTRQSRRKQWRFSCMTVYDKLLQKYPVDIGSAGDIHLKIFKYKIRLKNLFQIKLWAEVYFILSQFTRLTDGRTDRQTFFS